MVGGPIWLIYLFIRIHLNAAENGYIYNILSSVGATMVNILGGGI